MDQPFSEGTLSDDHAAVIVLDGAREDLTGGSAAAVHEDGERELLVNRLVVGGIEASGILCLAFGGDDRLAFGDEEVDDVNGFVEQASTVPTDVDDEALQVMVFLHVQDMLFHLVGCILGEAAETYVADAVFEHRGVGDVVDLDFFPFQGLGEGLVGAIAPDLDGYIGAGLSFEEFTDLFGVLLMGVHAVDFQDDVTSLKTSLLRRPSLVRVGDPDVFAVILDQSTDATVFARGHELVAFDFRLRNEDGVGVQSAKHGIDGSLVEFGRVDLVHIVQVQLPEEAVVNVNAF